MISELFLYDREKGLFKEILKKSSVIQGRYHVSPNAGNDLNTNNLETFIKDPASGLASVNQKYPICVCMTPRSRLIETEGGTVEEFTFILFFVCNTFQTGTNQIKALDRSTNTSSHPIPHSWADMKRCALEFRSVLKQLISSNAVIVEGASIPLRSQISLTGSTIINRLTKFNNDILTGVSMAFTVQMAIDEYCLPFEDYAGVQLSDITIPDFNIHPIHTGN